MLMGKLRNALNKAERSRNTMSVTIALLVLVGTLSFKYPLAFLVLLVLGLGYAVYRIIRDRNNPSTPQP
jgi:F0F1-type ATP synthase assembly protein I